MAALSDSAVPTASAVPAASAVPSVPAGLRENRFTNPNPQNRLIYPTAPTKSEICAFLYNELQNVEYKPRLDYKLDKYVIDVLLFDQGHNPVLIMTVYENSYDAQTWQGKRIDSVKSRHKRIRSAAQDLSQYGLPVVVICGKPAAKQWIVRKNYLQPAKRGFTIIK